MNNKRKEKTNKKNNDLSFSEILKDSIELMNEYDVSDYCKDENWKDYDDNVKSECDTVDDNKVSSAAEDSHEKKSKKTVITSIHKDHRKRVRNKIIKYGMETFTEFEVLEALLFYSIPLRDTNPIAHKLIEKFGTLKNVFSASYDELIEVDGISEVSATLIMMQREISKYVRVNDTEGKYLVTSDMVGQFCCNYFGSHLEESFIALSLSSNRKLISVDVISNGSENETAIYWRKLVKTILKNRCSIVILAHNHPDGNVNPSNEDRFLTNKIAKMFSEFGISVIDHIVCNGNTYVSMSDRGLITF